MKPRILLAATSSGVGKTTITTALISLLKRNNLKVSAFKCGPDYVDPMFHNTVLDTPSTNLDIFLAKEEGVLDLINTYTQNNEFALIEGVMGYYDGLKGMSTKYSANHVSLLTQTPTILIVDGRGVSVSLLATIQGFQNFAPNTIKGIIINRVSKGFYPILKKQIEEQLNIKVYGYLENNSEFSIDDRYLGLYQPFELENLHQKIQLLTDKASETIDIEGIIELGNSALPLPNTAKDDNYEQTNVTIGVVKDKAFSFIYKDNIKTLEDLGATIKYISLLEDKELPNDIDALIIPGGYPELHIVPLVSNKSMFESVKKTAENKLPIIAESGGFVYLAKDFIIDGVTYPMAGVIDTTITLEKTLQPFGYVNVTLNKDTIYGEKGKTFPAHEFHYTKSDNEEFASYSEKVESTRGWNSNYANDHIFAGYSQVHYHNNKQLAYNLIQKAKEYQKGKNNGK